MDGGGIDALSIILRDAIRVSSLKNANDPAFFSTNGARVLSPAQRRGLRHEEHGGLKGRETREARIVIEGHHTDEP